MPQPYAGKKKIDLAGCGAEVSALVHKFSQQRWTNDIHSIYTRNAAHLPDMYFPATLYQSYMTCLALKAATKDEVRRDQQTSVHRTTKWRSLRYPHLLGFGKGASPDQKHTSIIRRWRPRFEVLSLIEDSICVIHYREPCAYQPSSEWTTTSSASISPPKTIQAVEYKQISLPRRKPLGRACLLHDTCLLPLSPTHRRNGHLQLSLVGWLAANANGTGVSRFCTFSSLTFRWHFIMDRPAQHSERSAPPSQDETFLGHIYLRDKTGSVKMRVL